MPPSLSLTITRDPEGIEAARRLRHAVFVEELGAAAGSEAGAQAEIEGDRFDADSDHVLLRDPTRPEAGIVATARMRDGTGWTGRDFDLSALTSRGLRIAEVGRTCLHPDYRGGMAGLMLFKGIVDFLRARGVEAVIGTASFHGADPGRHLPALRALRARAPAPSEWRAVAVGPERVDLSGAAPQAAMKSVPPLIKTYLRAGAWVGEGARVDRTFNTVDVCLVLDMARLRMPGRVVA